MRKTLTRKIQLWFSFLLCSAMLITMMGTVHAEETKTIHIETAEDFLTFAKECRMDTYSFNLVVELEDDIDLTDQDFEAIPSFAGEFRGNGHTIRGLNIETEGSIQGLFRYVRLGATIQDLNLEGNIAPKGSRSYVGSLAGQNAGTIVNCSFSGSVSGSTHVGGLVGHNQLTGLMETCTVSGQINGQHFVGGLAGDNNGVIRECLNEASINITVQENAVELGDVSLDSVLESESAVTVTDVGGITGTNIGVIRECENTGNVGYSKIGYNMGGIAGSQSGYIVECVNRGEIMGRKEVGGIVGQMEPTMQMKFDEDTLQKLEKEMDTMMGMAGQTMSFGGVGLDVQIEDLEQQVKDAEKALTQMIEEAELPENLENIELPELGDLELPDNLGDLKLPEIGDLELPEIGDLELPEAGELPLPDEDSLDAAKNNLSSSIGMISGTMSDMLSSAQGTLGSINSSMQAMSNQMSVIGNIIKNADEDLGGNISDVSDADTEEETGSKVDKCENYGAVTGDANVGGIVGAISFESSLDPELDVTILGNFSLNFEGEVRSVVRGSQNYAPVTVYKQNGGGIAGRMNMGLVRECENRGALEGETATYVGGITGRADGGFIRNNITRCTLSGADYVGGVAGTAVVVSGCSSMTLFSGSAEKIGGVLGSIDEVTEDIADNYYLPVEWDMGGIDGISYEGSAQPLSAAEFFGQEQLPEDFGQITVRFIFEDDSEEIVKVDYGKELRSDKIPAVPEKEGASGRWDGIEEMDLSVLYFDVTLKATYDAYEKVIAAAALRADGRAILLAGSEFGKDALLEIEELTAGPVSVDEQETTLEAWRFVMTSMGETAKLRYLPPDEYEAEQLADDEARIMVRDAAGSWRDVSYTVEGSYLIFEVDQQDEGFCLVVQEGNTWLMYVLVGIGALVVVETAIFGAIWLRRRKR